MFADRIARTFACLTICCQVVITVLITAFTPFGATSADLPTPEPAMVSWEPSDIPASETEA